MENQINCFLDLMSTDGGCDLREKDGFYDSLYGQENQSDEQPTEMSRDSLDVGCNRLFGFNCSDGVSVGIAVSTFRDDI